MWTRTPANAATDPTLALHGEIGSGRASSLALAGPARAHPTPPVPQPGRLQPGAREVQKQVRNRVLTSAGHDDTLPTLTGVQMTPDGETLTMAATDHYRFAVAEVTAPATAQPPKKALTTLTPAGVPAPSAKRLKSYGGPRGHLPHHGRRRHLRAARSFLLRGVAGIGTDAPCGSVHERRQRFDAGSGGIGQLGRQRHGHEFRQQSASIGVRLGVVRTVAKPRIG
ncbi:hypothetical protein ACFU8W_30530 [Streptomyces sp. NPDC057565]|uniref:DNA polymerase III subunit beta family protein n=1 Tax=Streptomyces sp. NPDC057565 TaxID=3346169 RepID=UPI0036976453